MIEMKVRSRKAGGQVKNNNYGPCGIPNKFKNGGIVFS